MRFSAVDRADVMTRHLLGSTTKSYLLVPEELPAFLKSIYVFFINGVLTDWLHLPPEAVGSEIAAMDSTQTRHLISH